MLCLLALDDAGTAHASTGGNPGVLSTLYWPLGASCSHLVSCTPQAPLTAEVLQNDAGMHAGHSGPPSILPPSSLPPDDLSFQLSSAAFAPPKPGPPQRRRGRAANTRAQGGRGPSPGPYPGAPDFSLGICTVSVSSQSMALALVHSARSLRALLPAAGALRPPSGIQLTASCSTASSSMCSLQSLTCSCACRAGPAHGDGPAHWRHAAASLPSGQRYAEPAAGAGRPARSPASGVRPCAPLPHRLDQPAGCHRAQRSRCCSWPALLAEHSSQPAAHRA